MANKENVSIKKNDLINVSFKNGRIARGMPCRVTAVNGIRVEAVDRDGNGRLFMKNKWRFEVVEPPKKRKTRKKKGGKK